MLRQDDMNEAGVQGISGRVAPAAAKSDGDADGLPMPRRAWAIAAISFGTALFVLDSAVANVALPTIASELGVSNGAVTNVVTVYQLVLVMALLPFSSLGDRIGHRTMYQIGQVIFVIASALTFLVPDFGWLLAARAGQALGAGMALSVSAGMLRNIYPASKLGSGLGINSVIVASSAALAPTLGGFIVQHLDWRWVFVSAAPAAILSLLLGRSLPDPVVRQDRPLQLVSSIWSAVTVLLLIGGLQWATHGAAQVPAIGAIIAGIVSVFLLVRRERARANPVVPVDLLAKPVLGFSSLAAIAAFMASAALMVALPFRFQQGFGYSPSEVGLLLLPYPLVMLVVSPTAGWLSDRVDATKLGVTGMCFAITGLALLALMQGDPGPYGIAWRLGVAAFGFALFFSPNSRLIIGNAPRDRAAAAGGLLSTSRLLGQTLGAAMIGILLASGMGMGPLPMAFSAALAVVAALCSLVRFKALKKASAS